LADPRTYCPIHGLLFLTSSIIFCSICNANEMRPVLPGSLGLIDQTKVRLVDERSRLQRLFRSFAPHLSMSQPAELFLHQGNEMRSGIAPTVLHIGE
jgi:hypothetical protein